MVKCIQDVQKNMEEEIPELYIEFPNEGKQIILYHMGNYGYLPKMLIHKLHYHKGDRAIFLISVGPGDTQAFLQDWNEKNYDLGFVYVYSEHIFFHETDILTRENEIIKNFDAIFNEIGVPIEGFDTVYSAFDWHNALSAYMCIKNKKYVLFDITGMTLKDDESIYEVSRRPGS